LPGLRDLENNLFFGMPLKVGKLKTEVIRQFKINILYRDEVQWY
jgi:hypothetical protein